MFPRTGSAVMTVVDVVSAALLSPEIVIRGESGREFGLVMFKRRLRGLEYDMAPGVPQCADGARLRAQLVRCIDNKTNRGD